MAEKEQHGWISACPMIDRVIPDPMRFTELDMVEKICTEPQAQQEAAEDPDPILTQAPVPLTARKRSLLDMSENMHTDLVFGLHPAVSAAMAARPVLMNPKRPDGHGPQGENLRHSRTSKASALAGIQASGWTPVPLLSFG